MEKNRVSYSINHSPSLSDAPETEAFASELTWASSALAASKETKFGTKLA